MTDINKEIKNLSEISYDINKNGKDRKIDHSSKIVIINGLLKSISTVTPQVKLQVTTPIFNKLQLKCNSQFSYRNKYPSATSACTTNALLAGITLLENIKSNISINCNIINDIILNGIIAHGNDNQTTFDIAWSKLISKTNNINRCGKIDSGITSNTSDFYNDINTLYTKEFIIMDDNKFINIDDTKYTALIIITHFESSCLILPPIKEKDIGKENFIFFNSHDGIDKIDNPYTYESFDSLNILINKFVSRYPNTNDALLDAVEAFAIQLK